MNEQLVGHDDARRARGCAGNPWLIDSRCLDLPHGPLQGGRSMVSDGWQQRGTVAYFRVPSRTIATTRMHDPTVSRGEDRSIGMVPRPRRLRTWDRDGSRLCPLRRESGRRLPLGAPEQLSFGCGPGWLLIVDGAI